MCLIVLVSMPFICTRTLFKCVGMLGLFTIRAARCKRLKSQFSHEIAPSKMIPKMIHTNDAPNDIYVSVLPDIPLLEPP